MPRARLSWILVRGAAVSIRPEVFASLTLSEWAACPCSWIVMGTPKPLSSEVKAGMRLRKRQFRLAFFRELLLSLADEAPFCSHVPQAWPDLARR